MAKKADKRRKPTASNGPGGQKKQARTSPAVPEPSTGEEAAIRGLAWSHIRIPPEARWTPHPSDETQPWPMLSLLHPGRVVIDGKALRTMVNPIPDTNAKET